jgi:hypothetical protein
VSSSNSSAVINRAGATAQLGSSLSLKATNVHQERAWDRELRQRLYGKRRVIWGHDAADTVTTGTRGSDRIAYRSSGADRELDGYTLDEHDHVPTLRHYFL